MARSRVKAGGCTKGRARRRKIGMNSGKELAKGRVTKHRRGKS